MNDIETLIARDKITTQLSLYCKGVDECDWSLVKSCFGEEHIHHHQSFTGSTDEFISFASHTMQIVKDSHHSISNVLIDINPDGQSANSQAYFSAMHFIEGSEVSKMHFETDGKCYDTDWIVKGIYKDRWVCRDGNWLIIERYATHLWERIEATRRRELAMSSVETVSKN